MEDLEWEVSLMIELGIKVYYNQQFRKNLTYGNFIKDGNEKISFGVGLDNAKAPLSNDIYFHPTFFSSLQNDCEISKEGIIKSNKKELYKMHGHAIVLGIGDTALDCTRSALGLGDERVSVTFRRGFEDFRANDDVLDSALYEKIIFIPFSVPKSVNVEIKLVNSVEFYEYVPGKDGKYESGKNETTNIKCHFLTLHLVQ